LGDAGWGTQARAEGSETSVADIAWRGYGRVIKLARLVKAELAKQGHEREDYSIRKASGPGLREWEAQNPDKQQTRMRSSG
jgi:hypothetical protein